VPTREKFAFAAVFYSDVRDEQMCAHRLRFEVRQ
jgi:hypothetical protein